MSAADPARRKPQNQIERKLRVGLREAATSNKEFYFILLDIAPIDCLRSLNPGASLVQALTPNCVGFSAKWSTAYWFTRYEYGRRGSLTPLQSLLAAAQLPNILAREVANRMGGLTWAEVYKVVLRATIEELESCRKRNHQ
jgi:hypothetical protein